jgi:hypothetical protein
MARRTEERTRPRDERADGDGRHRDPMLWEDEIEGRDRRGRRWYLRSANPRRYDLLGYSGGLWLVVWLIVIGLIWWWAWAWAYYRRDRSTRDPPTIASRPSANRTQALPLPS